TKGVSYGKSKLRLIPCKALEGEGVVHLNLSDLPFPSHIELRSELLKALSLFGEVKYVGLKFEPVRGFFMGGGYVVLQRLKNHKFKTLTLNIFLAGCDGFCHATFTATPIWCRYRHSDQHTKYECQKSKDCIQCHSCDIYVSFF
ncbi:uncharacterized protein EV154DRAFT_417662, partial [Mucor mucedo]|uniref:uncharacterized protein n=1 Tax=Mucor mucedo TaxID=29922 RepID=UPI00221EB58E